MDADLLTKLKGRGEGRRKNYCAHAQLFSNPFKILIFLVLTRYCDYGENVGGDEDGKR